MKLSELNRIEALDMVIAAISPLILQSDRRIDIQAELETIRHQLKLYRDALIYERETERKSQCDREYVSG